MAKDIIVPTNPADLKKLKDGIKEYSNAEVQIEAQKEQQKNIIENLSEQSGIDKKFIRQMCKDFHKDQFNDKADEFENYTELYEAVDNA